jgi:beta-lactamase regulating signal transducer with metallopeptidase domain
MSVMTAFVQAFVWATIVGFLYISWVNNQVDSPIAVFERSYNVTRILQPLQSLWIVIGLCLIIALVLPALFPLLQTENNVSTSCITAPPQVLASIQADYSTAMVCPPSSSAPAHSDGTLHIANGGKTAPHLSP